MHALAYKLLHVSTAYLQEYYRKKRVWPAIAPGKQFKFVSSFITIAGSSCTTKCSWGCRMCLLILQDIGSELTDKYNGSLLNCNWEASLSGMNDPNS